MTEMARARNWRDVRADALEDGRITEQGSPGLLLLDAAGRGNQRFRGARRIVWRLV
jgi:hypothetical protein